MTIRQQELTIKIKKARKKFHRLTYKEPKKQHKAYFDLLQLERELRRESLKVEE